MPPRSHSTSPVRGRAARCPFFCAIDLNGLVENFRFHRLFAENSFEFAPPSSEHLRLALWHNGFSCFERSLTAVVHLTLPVEDEARGDPKPSARPRRSTALGGVLRRGSSSFAPAVCQRRVPDLRGPKASTGSASNVLDMVGAYALAICPLQEGATSSNYDQRRERRSKVRSPNLKSLLNQCC
jgi:hypothetical protein